MPIRPPQSGERRVGCRRVLAQVLRLRLQVFALGIILVRRSLELCVLGGQRSVLLLEPVNSLQQFTQLLANEGKLAGRGARLCISRR